MSSCFWWFPPCTGGIRVSKRSLRFRQLEGRHNGLAAPACCSTAPPAAIKCFGYGAN